MNFTLNYTLNYIYIYVCVCVTIKNNLFSFFYKKNNIIHYHTINMTLHPIESNALGYADTCHIKGPLVFLKICDELRICIL